MPSKGSEWNEKAEELEVELQQCYKAQSRLSEQLVVEVAESRASKALVQEKEATITNLENELTQARLVLYSPNYIFIFRKKMFKLQALGFSLGLAELTFNCRDECSRLSALLEEKTKALEIMMSENQEIKAQLEAATARANNAESENKMLIDRWMLQKMQDAERLNEV